MRFPRRFNLDADSIPILLSDRMLPEDHPSYPTQPSPLLQLLLRRRKLTPARPIYAEALAAAQAIE